MREIRWSHTIVVLTAASVLQTGVFDQVLIFGRVRVDLMLMVVLGVGMSAEAPTAALLGFITGLAVDLFRSGPFGLHALLFCLAGWSLVIARDRMLQAGSSFRTVQGAVAASVITAATWIGAAIFGQTSPSFTNRTLVDLAWVGLVAAVLVHPAELVGRWMVRPSSRSGNRTDLVRSE